MKAARRGSEPNSPEPRAGSRLPPWLHIIRNSLAGIAVFVSLWLTVAPDSGGRLVQLTIGAAAIAGTVLSVRFPALGAVVAAVSTVVAWLLGMTADPFLLAWVGVFAVAERRGSQRFPWWLLASGMVLMFVLLGFGAEPNDTEFGTRMRTVIVGAAITAGAWVLGVRTRQVREEAAERSRTEERLRLARDVHDVLSHSLGTIGVRAGVAAHVTTLKNPALRKTLRSIEEQARGSLAELKSLLRNERTRTADTEAPPVPLTELLNTIARAAEEAGIRTELLCSDEIDVLPVSVRTSAHRIVQEAVTNTIRHASAIRVKLTPLRSSPLRTMYQLASRSALVRASSPVAARTATQSGFPIV